MQDGTYLIIKDDYGSKYIPISEDFDSGFCVAITRAYNDAEILESDYVEEAAINYIEMLQIEDQQRQMRDVDVNDYYTTYLGVWYNEETKNTHYDLVIIVQDKELALNIAKAQKQISIWDLREEREIKVN